MERNNVDSSGLESCAECDHRHKLSKLRVEWYNSSSALSTSEAMRSSNTADSGFGASPLEEKPNNNISRRLASNPMLASDYFHQHQVDKDLLISCIKNEAETTQHIVDFMASTNTMRKHKKMYDDLTYRRRGVKAKEKLSSYSPRAPRASKWGKLFDNMIAKLRGQRLIESDEDLATSDASSNIDRNSLSSNSESVIIHENSCTYTQQCTLNDEKCQKPSPSEGDNYFKDEVLCEDNKYYEGVTSFIENVSTGSSEQDSDEYVCNTEYAEYYEEYKTFPCSDNHVSSDQPTSFWEDNWVSEPTTPSKSVEELCDVCSNKCEDGATPYTTPVSLCYKNNNCITSSEKSLQYHNAYFNQRSLSEELKSVLVRRPDLAFVTLPQAPIRKTDSNNLVWIERDTKPVIITSTNHLERHDKRTPWEKLKRLFSISK